MGSFCNVFLVLGITLNEFGLDGETMHTQSSSFNGTKASPGQAHVVSVSAAVWVSQLNLQNFPVFQFKEKRNTVTDQPRSKEKLFSLALQKLRAEIGGNLSLEENAQFL